MSDTDRLGLGPHSEETGGWSALVRHYENCLRQHGVTPRGVDWPNAADLAVRFAIMLEVLSDTAGKPLLLDLGCGPGLLLDYAYATGRAAHLTYFGIDLSAPMVDAARSRWPQHQFECRDIVADPLPDESVDVVVMNGVLCERVSLTVDQMVVLAQSLVRAAFRAARVGIAFNVMSTHVDWQRDDLFYWPFDRLAAFLKNEVSRHFAIRADYGLYEFTCFVWRHPRRPPPLIPETEWLS